MATITKGTTYSAGSTVTSTNLEAIITGASLSGVNRGDIDSSSASIVTRQSVQPPGPYVGEVWMKTTQSTLAAYVSSGNWRAILPFCMRVRAVSGTNLSSGDVVKPVSLTAEGVLRVNKSSVSAPGPGAEIGVAMESIAGSSHGLICVHGGCFINVTGAVSAGKPLIISATNGVARAVDFTDADDDPEGGIRPFAVALTDKDANDQVYAWLRR